MPENGKERCGDLLRGAGCGAGVIAHCRAVRDCACRYAARNRDADARLVERGAMLHDIGRGRTHGIGHAQCGADLVRSMGLGESLARIVECHTGAGLTADECTLLGISPRDCIPVTTEEKIVAHADNLIKGKNQVSIHGTIGAAYYLPRKARKRMYRLSCDVELLCGR